MEDEDCAIDDILASIPDSLLDARYYFYSNWDKNSCICNIEHTPSKFEFTFPLGDIASSSLLLEAEFTGHVLITRMGVRATVSYYDKPEVKVEVLVQKNLGDRDPVKGLQYWSLQVCNISRDSLDMFVDFGKYVHIRAHLGYSLEARVSLKGGVHLNKLELFVRVQSPNRVGGPYDHPSWSKDNFSNMVIKSPTKYCKYIDDGEDVAARRLKC